MRILIFSDIHANLPALKAVLKDAKNYDYIIFAGDAVDYGPNPAEVVDWLKENVDVWVLGNHDNAVAWNVDCGCGELTHELSVYTRENITYRLLEKAHIETLRTLPKRKKIEIEGLKFYIVHASPYNPLHAYVYPWLSDEEILNLMRERTWSGVASMIDADVVILGHTHFPMNKRITNFMIVNPGSVGQPRDEDNRASYGIFDVDKRTFEIRRVKYDVEKTIEEIKKLKLEKKYERWLISLLMHADARIAKEIAEKS